MTQRRGAAVAGRPGAVPSPLLTYDLGQPFDLGLSLSIGTEGW